MGSASDKILLLGGSGQVGYEVSCMGDDRKLMVPSRNDLDLRDHAQIRRVVSERRPDCIINAAAYTAVDQAESEPDAAYALNADLPEFLATLCAECDASLFHLSTDYVFDGRKGTPYAEKAPTNPVSVYGKSKLAGETAIRRNLDRHLIVRTSWVFSDRRFNFLKTMLHLAQTHKVLRVVDDQVGCPTPAQDIARTLLDLAGRSLAGSMEGRWGTYHYCGLEITSWYRFAEAIFEASAERLKHIPNLEPIESKDYPTPAVRPKYSVLDCSLLQEEFNIERPSWRSSLAGVIDSVLAQQKGGK